MSQLRFRPACFLRGRVLRVGTGADLPDRQPQVTGPGAGGVHDGLAELVDGQ
ncbi:hypothetical protein OHS81_03420 [Streptomyces sp. NBC_00400]|uniref:hypothetical protein n=1 Tax=Streptomyces sp. NBC_00400 TaxID=2975737 RepID=UPI002E21805C